MRTGANKPIHGHRRRAEGIPLLAKEFQANAETYFPAERVENALALFEDVERMEAEKLVEDFVLQTLKRSLLH